MSVDLEILHSELSPPASTIRLLVSDMDGTILSSDKKLTAATLAAVQSLQDAGITLCLASARPPMRMMPYVAQLDLPGYNAGFNGGAVFSRAGELIVNRVLPSDAVDVIIDTLHAHGVEIWLLRGGEWLVADPSSPFVEHEKRMAGGTPQKVADLRAHRDGLNKVMGVTDNHDLLARLETEIGEKLEGIVSSRRSHDDLLDITPVLANKGEAVRELAAIYGIQPQDVACIGDAFNDIPMFAVAGLSIAMGQAHEAVRARAHFITQSNDEGGWAEAVRRFVLPRAPKPAPKAEGV